MADGANVRARAVEELLAVTTDTCIMIRVFDGINAPDGFDLVATRAGKRAMRSDVVLKISI